MIVRSNRFGQIDAGIDTGSTPGGAAGFTPSLYFWLAVGAGCTVWFITRFLERKLR
jgi:hypothetical protein